MVFAAAPSPMLSDSLLSMYVCVYIYICSPPPPEDLPGGLYVARSVSASKHLAFGSNPSVCYTISHGTVVFALLISRTTPTKYL